MIKIISLLIMLIGPTYVGFEVALNYSKKEKFFSELNLFCNMLSNNIKFNKNKIKTVIFDNLDNYSNDLKDCLKNYIENKKLYVDFLNKYQNTKVSEFFNGLGNFDSNSEISYIENYKLLFQEFGNKCKEDNKRYGSMCSKIGVIVGLVLVILFI